MSGKKFDENDGVVIDHEQGCYQSSEVLWNCESLSHKVTQHIQEKTSTKGASNLTCLSCCEWVNEKLLPNEGVLESGFLR